MIQRSMKPDYGRPVKEVRTITNIQRISAPTILADFPSPAISGKDISIHLTTTRHIPLAEPGQAAVQDSLTRGLCSSSST